MYVSSYLSLPANLCMFVVLAPSKSEIQLALAEKETTHNVPIGSAAWLSFGLKLEEQQYVIVQCSTCHNDSLTRSLQT